jgi:serine/threonine-protein kinase
MVSRTVPGEGGAVFGRYRLFERLGTGGMGVVYRGQLEGALGFRRSVAIKRVRAELSRDRAFEEALLLEADLAGRLHHPAIVGVLELGEVDGERFLAMECVEGIDLLAARRACGRMGQPTPESIVAYVGFELAAALRYAHELSDEHGNALGIVHRDVSPSNVMLTWTGDIKLLDFGIAKALQRLRDQTTRTGMLKGKVGYMSPEQADGLPIDRRSDLFSLGIVLHECLTGKPLFRGLDDLHTLRLVRNAEVPRIRVERPGVDRDLEGVVMRLLARDPSDRFSDANAVVEALGPVVHRLHGDAAVARRWMGRLRGASSDGAPHEAGASGTDEVTRVEGEDPGRRVPRTLPFRHRGGVGWRSVLEAGALLAIVAVVAVTSRVPSRAIAENAPAVRQDRGDEGASPAPLRAPPSPPSLPAQQAAVPAAPETVRLTVKGPPGALVLLDGRSLGSVPTYLKLTQRAGFRRLSVRKSGFEAFVAELTANEDHTIVARLHRVRSPSRRDERSEIKDPFSR